MNQQLKKALFINYYFPPIHSIGVVRNYNIAKAMASKLSKIHVLTTSNRNILPQNDIYPLDEFEITALKTQDYRSKLKTQTHLQERHKNNIVFKWLRKCIDSYPLNIWYGEGGKRYINDGIKKGYQFLIENPQAIIYTSFRPYADIYIGYKLKEAFPSAKWIVDFRDLHVDPLYKNVIFPKWQHNHNKSILKNTDAIITVSEGLKNNLSKVYGNVHKVYNGININKSQFPKFPKFTISYTGSMFGNKRNPDALFRWLREKIELNEIEKSDLSIIYAGKDSFSFGRHIKEYNFQDIYKDHGLVSSEEAKKIQCRSNVNLLLTSSYNNHEGILTGKLFEYLGSLTPTLVVFEGHLDRELISILENAGHHCVFSKKENQGEKLLSWYKKWKQGTLITNSAEKIKKEFSWDYAADKILALI